MQLGAQLKLARQTLGVTQEVVASQLHVSRQTISSWENERSYPDIASLIALSDYYQLSLDELLKEDNGMAADLVRKERALKEAHRIWLMSFMVNLLLVALLLADTFSLFDVKMNSVMAFILAVVILLNSYLLLVASHNYQRLKPNSSVKLGILKKMWVLLVMVLGVVTIFAFMQRTFLALGAVVGALVAAACIYYYIKR
ncbi:helix-turn-helix domain-containing protein [Loigolactobacillus zhaoyuanensis]|uniref:Helix-turn-helix domain-containing protein n=1 Tax=Loigolactobacillus zhaoyuanensis TaxID=2486017 RepID=A0ABW8UF75_9LACO|nr:helix-turn-helix transcriptional regulator [Loigolactobacillus zhaoyuanensis]